MKDFANASFPRETIVLMTIALDNALAELWAQQGLRTATS
jgi:hypothetical protein